ncbi:MAG TPA: peptide ABC transporter substrate-binding protein [Candidatus Baltobacteraceae bacterium]
MLTITKTILATCAIVTTFALSGCAQNTNRSSGGPLTIAQIQEPRSLDPLFVDGYVSGELDGLVYSYLTTYGVGGNMLPQVARVVPTVANGGISRDGRTLRFHLRHDVKWQDGVALTSRDVVFSFHAIMNPKNATLSRYGYDQMASVVAKGRWEVDVTYKHRFAAGVSYFFGGDSNYPVMPAHLLDRYPSLNQVPFNGAPIGSGPYRVAEWQRGDHITFVANDAYFLGKPKIPKIVLRFVPDNQTIVDQLHTGEVDLWFFADVSHIAELRGLPGHHLVTTPTTEFQTVQFNTQSAIFSDGAVRRAFSMAIDSASTTRKIYRGVYDPQHGLRGLFTWAYDPAIGPVPYDPAGARALLQRDGWIAGPSGMRAKDGHPMEVTLLFTTGSPTLSTLVAQIAAYEREVGIAVTLRGMSTALLTSPGGPLYRGTYQAAMFSLMSSADPDASWLLSCDQRAPAGFNLTRFCDAAAQRAFAHGASTMNRESRKDDYRIVQRRLSAVLPMDVLFLIYEMDVVPEALKGYTPSLYTSPYTFAYQWRLAAR